MSYFRDRDVLIERSSARGEALTILQALPARMGYIEPPPKIEVKGPPMPMVVEVKAKAKRRMVRHYKAMTTP